MFDRRMKVILGIVAVVVVAVAVYGVYRIAQPKNPYEGLTLTRETQIDEATRFTLEQRMSATNAAIALAKESGEEVDNALYLSLANDAYILGDLVTAREALEAYINKNSLNAAVWNTYGNILAYMGDVVPADKAYTQAINLGGPTEYYMDYVRYLQKYFPERNDDIQTIIEFGIERLGRNETFMVALGEWYWEKGDCTRAIDHYEIAQEMSPANTGLQLKIEEIRSTCKE